MKYKSPAKASGISFPYPFNLIGELLGIPFSIGTSKIFSFSIIFLPLQVLHFPPSPII